MDVATTSLAERIARALAGLDHSANGAGVEQHASGLVDETWRSHLNQASAILRTIREPSNAMAAAGDPQTWADMVEIAIEEGDQL